MIQICSIWYGCQYRFEGNLRTHVAKIYLFTTSNGMVIIDLQAHTRDFLKTKHNLIYQTLRQVGSQIIC